MKRCLGRFASSVLYLGVLLRASTWDALMYFESTVIAGKLPTADCNLAPFFYAFLWCSLSSCRSMPPFDVLQCTHKHPDEASSVVHTGLQFFPGFLNADRRAVLDRAALAYQKWGRQQMKLRGTSGPPIEFFSPAPPLPLLTELEDAVTRPLDSVSPSPNRPSVAALKEPSQGDTDTFYPLANVDKYLLRMSLVAL